MAKKAVQLYQAVYNAGARVQQLSLPWDDVEVVPGVVNSTLVAEILATTRAAGLTPLFNLAVIDTDRVAVPVDLVDPSDPTRLAPGLNWTSPVLIDRYASALAVIAPLVAYYGGPYFGLGNEVSSNLRTHPEYASSFVQMTYIMREYVQNITSPDLAVGVTLVTGDLVAMSADPPTWLTWLWQVADVTPLTHYPLQGDFHVIPDPAQYSADVATAVSMLPPDMAVVLQEFGCPAGYGNASSTDGASQALQAQYFTTMLDLMAGQLNGTTGRVRLASAYSFLDMPPAVCASLGPYYNVTSDPAFIEYLCTLGMVDGGTGQAKQAYQAFLEGIRAAGAP